MTKKLKIWHASSSHGAWTLPVNRFEKASYNSYRTLLYHTDSCCQNWAIKLWPIFYPKYLCWLMIPSYCNITMVLAIWNDDFPSTTNAACLPENSVMLSHWNEINYSTRSQDISEIASGTAVRVCDRSFYICCSYKNYLYSAEWPLHVTAKNVLI